MRAVWARARAELRSGWRRSVAIVLLIALAAGAVMALTGGARRTRSAYPRFLEAHAAYDVLVVNYPADGTAVFDFDEISRLPMVADFARGPMEYVNIGSGVGGVASPDGRIGRDINRFEMLSGRPLDPTRPEEIVIGFDLAERHGLEVGSRVPFLDMESLEASLENAPPEERALADHYLEIISSLLPDGRLEVVGIEASPGEFPPQFAFNGLLVHVSPALAEQLWTDTEVLMVRLERGEADVPAFQAELERRSGGRFIQKLDQHIHAAAVQRSINVQVVALWLLAALTALVAALVLGQTIVRTTVMESDDVPVLAALGMTRSQLAAVGLVRWTMVGAAGGAIGAAIAVLASPLFPVGLARTAEPSPGIRVDVSVVAAGSVVTVLAIVLLAAVPVVRAVWSGTRPGHRLPSRPSRLVGLVSAVGFPPAAIAGLRMGLERGRGRTAVPVATTVAGITIGVAALIGALTFGASLSHLLDHPDQYGLRWDREVMDWESGFDQHDLAAVRSHPGVAAAGTGEADNPLLVGGIRADAVIMDPVKGETRPPVVKGRMPVADDEIALGKRTMRDADAQIGDKVRVGLTSFDAGVEMRVVGQVVLPALSSVGQLGEGALLSRAAGGALAAAAGLVDDDTDEGGTILFVVFADGADPDRVIRELGDDMDRHLVFLERGRPTDIVNFGRVESMPLLLGAILAGLAAATLAHAVLTTIRRRQRDLAILKTLGFSRRQVVAAVTWQASTVAAAALLLALPLGVAAGRWSWTAFADQLGVVADPQVPFGPVLLIVPATILLANLIAVAPARLAARTSPALVLRAE